MAFNADTSMKWAHPLVKEWFLSRFGSPTEPQLEGWPHISASRDTLISAPTGSGKTLAAFLVCIDQLVRKALAGKLENRTEVLYVSPLKALSNDVQKNLETPLRQIMELARERGYDVPEIRTAVRTGDTLADERRKMIKRPPHIMVTTPESLYILLTAEKSRAILQDVTTVIVDEIHAVADDKRGSHLMLSLERLEALAHKKVVRIGLSATQKPIELIAQYLVGSRRKLPVIVNVGHKRQLDVQVVSLAQPLGAVATTEMWQEIYDHVVSYTETHRSILVFVNTRKFAERMAFNLSQRLGEDAVAAHHGSLSRKIRLNAEHRLKTGKLKVLVATASLELGIDIGDVDLVCLVSSPRSIAAALQRIGRAGHWRGAVPKGRIFATTRDDLIECAALGKSIHDGQLDRLIIPDCPNDILAQQIVAACSAEEWAEDDLFGMCTSAYPYRGLTRETFEAVLDMLTDGFEGRSVKFGAYLHRDLVNQRVKGRRGSRLTAVTNGGAIPETGQFTMVAQPEEITVGTLDEDFAVESNAGDVILLGNTSWRIRRVEQARSRVLVEDAHGAAPTVPFWRGEAPGRTMELSAAVAAVRSQVDRMLPDAQPGATLVKNDPVEKTITWLQDSCGLQRSGAEQAIEYLLEGRAVVGAVPTQDTIIAERFFDESGGMQLVIHAPFGARINKAWGMALRKRFCRSFNLELQAAATDDGLNIALSEKHSFPLADIFLWLHPNSVAEVVEQAALQAPIFNTRWRWDATRALALLRFRAGKKIAPQLQRMRAEDLLATVFPEAAACQDNIDGDLNVPNHPLINEVMKDVMQEALDVEGLKEVLTRIGEGKIKCIAVDTPVPSQFSHEILNANPYAYLDDAPIEERRARAVEMRRLLPASIVEQVGRLDPNALARVTDEAWPDVRDADDLHDALLTFIGLPETLPTGALQQPNQVWSSFMDTLMAEKRAAIATVGSRIYWVAAERRKSFNSIFPDATFSQNLKDVEKQTPTREDAITNMVRGWIMHSGPVTAAQLSERLGLAIADVDRALIMLENAGQILRGNFTANDDGVIEWCERRLLARIHKLTIGILRQEIEPVTAAQFMRWLLRWQHVASGTQLSGERGLLEVLKQLQGFEIPANGWERQVLAKRVANYDPADLDHLCLSGVVGWGRLSPHPSMRVVEDSSIVDNGAPARRRIVPTSVAPITFFVRQAAGWMTPRHPQAEDSSSLSQAARDVYAFMQLRGASFYADIARAVNHLQSEVENGLWELVTAGLVTADGFDNLRSLIDPKRRAGQGRARNSRPRNSTGRWSLLFSDFANDHQQQVEATCGMLLNRYGIVFRDLLTRENLTVSWRDLLIAFRRLEDRGEVRGGRFISGFLGEQFALPVAVESLRAMRKQEPNGERATISGADPLNLVGILIPGDKIAAVSTNTVTFTDGLVQPLQGAQLRAI
jgi:ATP-dependent helicase Lhr and Lhr-like helicase